MFKLARKDEGKSLGAAFGRGYEWLLSLPLLTSFSPFFLDIRGWTRWKDTVKEIYLLVIRDAVFIRHFRTHNRKSLPWSQPRSSLVHFERSTVELDLFWYLSCCAWVYFALCTTGFIVHTSHAANTQIHAFRCTVSFDSHACKILPTPSFPSPSFGLPLSILQILIAWTNIG